MFKLFKAEIIEFLSSNFYFGDEESHISQIAPYNRLDLLKITYSETDAFRKTTDAMDKAAESGKMECLEYLSGMGAECTTRAMDGAAGNDHLKIVQWLHINRNEGCSTEAMDSAAANGELDIVKWLHVNRLEGCTTGAMDEAFVVILPLFYGYMKIGTKAVQ